MEKNKLSLTVLFPVYNQGFLLEGSMKKLKILKTSPHLSGVQVIIIDDGSNDGTSGEIDKLHNEIHSSPEDVFFEWIFLKHEKNLGKGKSIQTSLEKTTGDLCVIHDASDEYNPEDILKMIPVFLKEQADAVFTVRSLTEDYYRIPTFNSEVTNKFLTLFCNFITNINLTEISPYYKVIRTRILKSIPLESNDFFIYLEILIKLARRGARIFQVPINYSENLYEDSKKWYYGFKTFFAIFKYWMSDRLFTEDNYLSIIISELACAPKYNKWMIDHIRSYVGDNILEIGSGIGNIAMQLFPCNKYFATDINSVYLEHLKNMQSNRPYLKVFFFDVTDIKTFPQLEENDVIDTVICINVIEHLDDDRSVLLNIKSLLKSGGRAIIIVPNNPSIYGSLDEVNRHRRRYTMSGLEKLLRETDFEVEKIFGFNRLGTLAWWFNGKVLKRKHFSKFQAYSLNFTTPFLKWFDMFLPLPPLSLVAVVKVR